MTKSIHSKNDLQRATIELWDINKALSSQNEALRSSNLILSLSLITETIILAIVFFIK